MVGYGTCWEAKQVLLRHLAEAASSTQCAREANCIEHGCHLAASTGKQQPGGAGVGVKLNLGSNPEVDNPTRSVSLQSLSDVMFSRPADDS